MEQPPPLRTDFEFHPRLTERSLPPVVDPGAYRRVLANPFPGILGASAWVGALRQTLIASAADPTILLPMLGILIPAAWFIPRLFRFQCLDCGRTGRMSRWKSHACPAVASRIVRKAPRRFRGPSPLLQSLLWSILLVIILIAVKASGIRARPRIPALGAVIQHSASSTRHSAAT